LYLSLIVFINLIFEAIKGETKSNNIYKITNIFHIIQLFHKSTNDKINMNNIKSINVGIDKINKKETIIKIINEKVILK
jgi:hypothetical protein